MPSSKLSKDNIIVESAKCTNWGNGDVTPREVLFCGLIFGFLMLVGCFISSAIKARINDKNLKYNQAVQISNQSEFEQAFNTDIGHAFVQGHFSCEGVSYNGIDGKYLEINVSHEEYREHTRTETYTITDSKGRTQTKTKIVHYWTWDTMGNTHNKCNVVNFKGRDFVYDNFDYGMVKGNTQIVPTGFHKRDVVYTKPREFDCTVFCQMVHKSFQGKATIYYGMGLGQAHQYAIAKVSSCLALFWILWLIISIAICACFVGMENDWLNE